MAPSGANWSFISGEHALEVTPKICWFQVIDFISPEHMQLNFLGLG